VAPRRLGTSGSRVGATTSALEEVAITTLYIGFRRSLVAALAALVLVTGVGSAWAGPPPPPPERRVPPPPADDTPPAPEPYPAPPGYYPVPVEPPPPLSPTMRAIYAPFYAAGLVLRYGVYYVIVAPFEVFARALTYGVEGGVDQGEEDDSDR